MTILNLHVQKKRIKKFNKYKITKIVFTANYLIKYYRNTEFLQFLINDIF